MLNNSFRIFDSISAVRFPVLICKLSRSISCHFTLLKLPTLDDQTTGADNAKNDITAMYNEVGLYNS